MPSAWTDSFIDKFALRQFAQMESTSSQITTTGSFKEVFAAYLKLGLSSFGGPIAHLSYFRQEFVEKRKWLSESQFAQLLALCQFLPGPASSQLGFAIGLLRAGYLGAIAAFLAFTLPSALLLLCFAKLLPHFSGPIGLAAIHGLKLVALAVVAHGVLGMSKRLCPDATRATIATCSMGLIIVSGQAWVQLLSIAIGGFVGLVLCRDLKSSINGVIKVRYSKKLGAVFLVIFASLLLLLPLIAQSSTMEKHWFFSVAEPFYRAGALVFGGGHVVLPLLEEAVVKPGLLNSDQFLAGYGAAQAIPGPMFSFAAYLGALLQDGQGSIISASIALVFIFLPGFLLLSGILPFWQAIASQSAANRAIAGINAAVVGLLGAALYDPVWTSAVNRPLDLAIALFGFTLFAAWKLSALVVVIWCVSASIFATLML